MKILLADDHPLFIDGLSQLINQQENFILVAKVVLAP